MHVSSHGYAKANITKQEQDRISKTQKEAGRKGKGRGKGRKKGKGKESVQEEDGADANSADVAAPKKGKGGAKPKASAAKAKAKAKVEKPKAKAKAKVKADKVEKAEGKAQAKKKAKGKAGDAEPEKEGCNPKRRRGTPEETKQREALRATLPSYEHVALDIYWSRSSVGVKIKNGVNKGKQAWRLLQNMHVVCVTFSELMYGERVNLS